MKNKVIPIIYGAIAAIANVERKYLNLYKFII